MGHLQQAGHDSLADADGEMPAPADVPLRGRAGPEQRAGLEHRRPGPAGHRRTDCLYRMSASGRMMSVNDGTEADVMSMADRPAGQPERPGPRRLTRSRTDRMVAGVCGGFAAYSGIDVTIVRLVMVLLAVLGGTGVLLYLIAWVIVPVEDAVQAAGNGGQ
jgi:phage shock protein C